MSKGRGNSNSITVKEALRLNIDKLRRDKCINIGASTSFVTNWSGGESISSNVVYTENEKALTLKYSYQQRPIEYSIKIVEVKSNLGKGVNLYFVCPVTNRKCKYIYCCYGSDIFKSRQAYTNRIYYLTQTCSKATRTATRNNVTENKISALYRLRRAINYRGKVTRRKQRLTKLFDKKRQIDILMGEELEAWLYNYLGLERHTKQ